VEILEEKEESDLTAEENMAGKLLI